MKLKWILGILVIAAAIPVALSLRTERSVTTKSDQAYNFYLEGIENANRLYNKEALENFEAAVSHDSTFASAWANLSRYYAIRGRKEEAAIAADRAFQLAAKLPEKERLNISLLTADIRQDYTNYDENLDLMLKKYPNEIEPHLILAGRYWKKGETDKAISEYETVYRINPNYALVYNSLGYLHAQSGYYSKAIEYMKKYVFIAPDQANPYDSLGDILIRVGRYREALDQFDKAIAVKPTLAIEPSNLGYAIQLHMAIALMRLGKLQEAKYRFNRALDLSTGEWAKGEVTAKSTELYRTQGQYSKAIARLLEAQNPDGYNRATNLTLGLIYSDVGDVDKIDKLIDENFESTLKCVQKCVKDSIEITEENYAQYLDDCGKCQILTWDANLLKAFHECAAGRYLKAAERVDKLIAEEDASQTKMFLLYLSSSLYFKAGEYQQALETLEPYIEINPYDPDVILLRAETLIKLDQLDDAEGVLKMFVHATDGADADWIPRVKARTLLAKLDRKPLTMN